MIEPQTWVADALARMKKAFGPRLAYLVQGSYRRGEATETSDIDLVVLLDTVEPVDLDIYRSIVHALPEGHKACGFCSGTEEFFHWPRHELLPFSMDTDDYYGRLKDFLPPLSQEDARAGAKIGASALLHLLTHSYLYAEPEARTAILKDASRPPFSSCRSCTTLPRDNTAAVKKSCSPVWTARKRKFSRPGWMSRPGWPPIRKHRLLPCFAAGAAEF